MPLNIPLVELPDPLRVKAVQQLRLSPEDAHAIHQFAQDGYYIFHSELPPSLLDSAAQTIRQACYDAQGNLRHHRLMDAWLEYDVFRQIAMADKVLHLLRLFYQREPIPFQTLNFPVGTEQLTHSDTIHFHSFPPRYMCGVWIALEDVDADNGPLHYYTGSHKLPIYELYDTGSARGRWHFQLRSLNTTGIMNHSWSRSSLHKALNGENSFSKKGTDLSGRLTCSTAAVLFAINGAHDLAK
jgi:hypothetical protein